MIWQKQKHRKVEKQKSRKEEKQKSSNAKKQAGAELGQAQLKLGLGFSFIFCRFGFS